MFASVLIELFEESSLYKCPLWCKTPIFEIYLWCKTYLNGNSILISKTTRNMFVMMFVRKIDKEVTVKLQKEKKGTLTNHNLNMDT